MVAVVDVVVIHTPFAIREAEKALEIQESVVDKASKVVEIDVVHEVGVAQ